MSMRAPSIECRKWMVVATFDFRHSTLKTKGAQEQSRSYVLGTSALLHILLFYIHPFLILGRIELVGRLS
jgi:hypothetical protein